MSKRTRAIAPAAIIAAIIGTERFGADGTPIRAPWLGVKRGESLQTTAPYAKKVPSSVEDSARLRKAEMKRRRKAAKRNLDRAVIINTPRLPEPSPIIASAVGFRKSQKLLARAAKAAARGVLF